MNITCILGSPRVKGNSAAIARRFCDKAGQMGAKVRYFNLNELNYKGCQACMACKTKSDRCILDDDLTQVLDAVMDADVVVMTSPVYMGDMSGQLKCFIDRTYSFMGPDFRTNPNASRLSPGKKLVFIMTQGAPAEDMFNDIHPKIEGIFHRHGFSETVTIRGCGLREEGEAETRDDLMELAEKTAERMVG